MSPMRYASARRAGQALLLGLALFALLGPSLVGSDPRVQDLRHSLQPPSALAWLGTDLFGRDVLARLAQAAQRSLGLALLAASSAALVGTALGVAAAWRGGAVARLLGALADAALALPGLLLVLLFSALTQGELWSLYLGLALSLWVEYFRVTRALAARVLHGDAVEASRLLGFGPGYVLRRHLLPALAPMLAALLPLSAAQAVLALAALGFIGVGLQPPLAELGLMMTEYLPHYEEAPWLIAAPVLLLGLLVLGLLLAGSEGKAEEGLV